MADEKAKPRRFEPLSADRYGVHFTADGEFCELLDRVRGLAGHRLPSGDLMTVLKRGLEAYERELEKERFAVGRQTPRSRNAGAMSRAPSAPEVRSAGLIADELPKVASPKPELTKSAPRRLGRSLKRKRRHYSSVVVRAVYLRDGEQCSFVSPDGRRCCSRQRLELDHIEPVAVGGADTIENLRLLCRAHNQRYARLYFGKHRIEVALRSFRQRSATLRDGDVRV